MEDTKILESDSWISFKRFEIGDPRLDGLLKSFHDAFGSHKFNLILAFPGLRHVFPEWSGWNHWKSVSYFSLLPNHGFGR